jgi:hypothetical protein
VTFNPTSPMPANQPELPVPATDACELRVLSGPQRGARAPLPAGGWTLHARPDALTALPNGDERADVLLLAGCAARVAVQRQPSGAALVLRLLDGDATLGSRTLAHHGETSWPAGMALQVGDTVVAYGPVGEAWPATLRDAASERHADAAVDESLASPASPATPAPAPARVPGRPWPVWLAGLGAVLVAASASLAFLGQIIPANANAPSDRAALQAARPSSPEHSVAEVFRLHGIKVSVEPSAAGGLDVFAQEADSRKLARAEAAVRRDVPGAPTLRVVNRPPTRAAPRPALQNDPGKRITAVVTDAELPYIVTADGSRYFHGALLPSGHRVVGIADRQVTVELDGQATELTL